VEPSSTAPPPTATGTFFSEASPATVAPVGGGALPTAGSGPGEGAAANYPLLAVILVSLVTGVIAFRYVSTALEE
jgi:hypothetical protein